MKEKKPKKDTKSVKVLKGTHRKLKIYVAKSGDNITEFVSYAIEECIKKP